MAITRIGKGLSYIAILNALQLIVGIAFYYVVSNILTAVEIGIMSTLNFAYATFMVLAPLGLQFGAVKYVAEYSAKNELGRAATVAKTMTKLVTISSIGFLAFFIIIIFGGVRIWTNIENVEMFFVVISAAAAIGVMRNAYLALLQGLQLFDKYAIANLVAMSLSKILGMIFVLLGFDLFGVVIGIFLGEIFGLILTYLFFHGKLPENQANGEARVLFTFSLPIFGMMVVTTFQDWADRVLFLVMYKDLEALGLFELVIRASTSLGVIGAIVDVIMLPTLSEAFARGGKSQINNMMKTALRYLGFLYFPAALGMATISRTVMTILYQAKTAEAGYLPLTILAIFSIFGTFATILNSGLKSIGRTASFIRISVTALIVDGIIVTLLSPSLGLYGAVVARSAALFVTFVFTLFLLRKEIVLKIDREGVWKGSLAAASIIPPILLLDRYVVITHILLSLFAEIALAVSTYLFALLVLKALRKCDFHILRQILPNRIEKLLDILERLYIH